MIYRYMNPLLLTACLVGGGSAAWAAPMLGEANEPSPESLDANFSEEDARRMQTAFVKSSGVKPALNPFQAMADSADLVFAGTVKRQTFSFNSNNQPLTHTTFSVDKVLKGSYTGDELTIVQLGGPAADGQHALLVSDAQHFREGDEELLFVNLSSPTSAPYSNGVEILNRYGLHENKLYDADGHGVVAAQDGQFMFSHDRNPARRFTEIDMGTHVLIKKFGDDAGKPADHDAGRRPGAASSSVLPSYRDSIDLDTFKALLES